MNDNPQLLKLFSGITTLPYEPTASLLLIQKEFSGAPEPGVTPRCLNPSYCFTVSSTTALCLFNMALIWPHLNLSLFELWSWQGHSFAYHRSHWLYISDAGSAGRMRAPSWRTPALLIFRRWAWVDKGKRMQIKEPKKGLMVYQPTSNEDLCLDVCMPSLIHLSRQQQKQRGRDLQPWSHL